MTFLRCEKFGIKYEEGTIAFKKKVIIIIIWLYSTKEIVVTNEVINKHVEVCAEGQPHNNETAKEDYIKLSAEVKLGELEKE